MSPRELLIILLLQLHLEQLQITETMICTLLNLTDAMVTVAAIMALNRGLRPQLVPPLVWNKEFYPTVKQMMHRLNFKPARILKPRMRPIRSQD